MIYELPKLMYVSNNLKYRNSICNLTLHKNSWFNTCSSTFICLENSFAAWHSFVSDRNSLYKKNMKFITMKKKPLNQHILHIDYGINRITFWMIRFCYVHSKKESSKNESINLIRSNDLNADELITRSAGQPGSTCPSLRFFPQSTSFHEDPKATFTCSPKLPAIFCAGPWPSSSMRVSANF